MAASRNLSDAERKSRAALAGHTSWQNTENRSARTAPARAALLKKFEDQVDPQRKLPEAERRQRAESARKAHLARMTFESSKRRRARRAAAPAAELQDGGAA